MRIAAAVFAFVMKSGGVGLLLLGILDSSFLFMPWGNDVLVVALTARHPALPNMLYYAFMSTVGSVIGCWLIDLVFRRLGSDGLKKHLSERKMAYVVRKMEQHGGKTLALASLAPPPFPFTAFVMAAAALQYSRQRLLVLVAVTRMIRFTALGLLAMRFGERILKWGENPVVQGLLIGLTLLCIGGSIVSVVGWLRRNRRTAPAPA